MNFKKILLGLVAVALTSVSLAPVANAAINDPEFDAALAWMYDMGYTKYNTAEGFMPYATLTREAAAKFLATHAVTNLCLETVDAANCDFSDVPADPSLGEYVALACELGLVKGSGGKYMPTAPMTKAAVITVLSRAMAAAEGKDAPSEDVAPRWANHLTAARAAGITKETNAAALDRSVTRYEVALMLYRARVEAAECSDVNVEDLLNDLFGDDTTTDTTGEDTTDDVVTESNGTAKAMLSATTPNGATVPGKVTAKVATFEFAATTEDVVLSEITLERKGLGSDNVVADLTLFANNEVVTKSRNFNSDDTVTFSLNPAVTIKAGTKVSVDVVATMGDALSVSNEEFSVALVDFATNGTDDTANLPANANTFRIAGVNGAIVEVTKDGNVSNVDLGDTGVEVAKFQLDNTSNNDVSITQITIEDDKKNADEDLKNFVLKHNGSVVASSAMANGKYVTFVLSTPVVIKQGENEDFRVYADVVGGAGDEISFIIDQEIYVLGKDAKYGYGIAVDVSAYTVGQTFAINAGELTLVEKALDPDQFREDQDERVLASFDVNVNAGQDLSLEDMKFVLNGTASGSNTWGTVFENAELWVWINGSKRSYNLDESADSTTSVTYSDTDLGILLPSTAKITVQLVADTMQDLSAADIGRTFSVTMAMNNGVEFIENADDEIVTDIVPSTITFDTVELVESSVSISKLSLGNIVSVVRGAMNTDALKFQMQADDVSSVFVDSFTFNGVVSSGSCTFSSSTISAVKLWKATASGYTLLEQQGGFDIVSNSITFDDFNEVEIAASATQVFLVTVDVADSQLLAGCEFGVRATDAQADDDDNNTLTVNVLPTTIGRTIKITDAGTLSIKVDNTDSKTNKARHVLAGTTSDYVASFEVNAVNEAIEIEDLVITANGSGAAAFGDAVSEVVIYNEAGTELFREQVVSSSVMFDNINFVAPLGTTNLYVKVITDLVGNNANGSTMDDVTLTLTAQNVDGDSSNVAVTPTYDGAGTTLASYAFDVISVHLSDIQLVTSYSTYSVSTSTANGSGTNLAIVKVTANTWNNTDVDDNSALDLVLKSLALTNSAPAVATNLTLKRIDISNGTEFAGTVAGNLVTFDVDAQSALDYEISKGSVAYYLVRGDISALANTTVRLDIKNLDTGSVVYDSTDLNSEVDALRLSSNEVTGPSVTVTVN